MKYYIDTEFLNGPQIKTFLGIPYGKTRPFIDLISIGIVCEDKREYYAISKEFNIKEAWNRFQLKETSPVKKSIGIFEEKEYWIRENVLYPIYKELLEKEYSWEGYPEIRNEVTRGAYMNKFGSYAEFKQLINKYGKTNKEIAKEIKGFCHPSPEYTREIIEEGWGVDGKFRDALYKHYKKTEFFGYYCAFDYVVFSQLFGSFDEYPKEFPQHFVDLKQRWDREISYYNILVENKVSDKNKEWIKNLKPTVDFLEEVNDKHHALDDAKWIVELNRKLWRP
jgi:hypothetical protein